MIITLWKFHSTANRLVNKSHFSPTRLKTARSKGGVTPPLLVNQWTACSKKRNVFIQNENFYEGTLIHPKSMG
jgi:hypothetical protein